VETASEGVEGEGGERWIQIRDEEEESQGGKIKKSRVARLTFAPRGHHSTAR